MERWLRRANPGRRIEVLILAVPGYSSHQGRAWLRRDIARLDPDIVTICFGWNDIGLRVVPDCRSLPVDRLHQTARRAWLHSQALIHLSRWIGARRGKRAPSLVPRVAREEFVDNHLAMIRLARGRGARALVIGAVYRDAETSPEEARRLSGHRDALARRMEREGVAYLSVEALTEVGFPENQGLFGERIHPNRAGHRLLAQAVLDGLALRGMLAGLAWTSQQPAG
jgi:lysophospholipase L1-like esterase